MRTYRFWFNDENFRIIEARNFEEALEQLTEEERSNRSFAEGVTVRGVVEVEYLS